MNLQLAQLRAMIHYELLMSWRRRSLIATVLFLMIGLALFVLTLSADSLRVGELRILSLDDTVTPPTVTMENLITGEITTTPADDTVLQAIPQWLRNVNMAEANATFHIVSILTIITQLLIILLLLMGSETFPLDKIYRVRELLNALPLGKAAYLIGKLGGMWAGLLAGMLLSMLVFIPIFQWRLGSFDLNIYLLTWAALLIPAAIFAAGLGALGAAGMSTRRGAVLVGLALVPVGVFVFALVVAAVLVPLINLSTVSGTYSEFTGGILSSVTRIMLTANLALFALGVAIWALMRFRSA